MPWPTILAASVSIIFGWASFLAYQRHDDVIKWKHFPRNWPFVRKIHRSPVNFPHKGQWRGALMFSLIYVWINDWANNREAGDLRRQHGHYDVIVMICKTIVPIIAWAVSGKRYTTHFRVTKLIFKTEEIHPKLHKLYGSNTSQYFIEVVDI